MQITVCNFMIFVHRKTMASFMDMTKLVPISDALYQSTEESSATVIPLPSIIEQQNQEVVPVTRTADTTFSSSVPHNLQPQNRTPPAESDPQLTTAKSDPNHHPNPLQHPHKLVVFAPQKFFTKDRQGVEV